MHTVKGRNDKGKQRKEAGGQAQGTAPGDNRNSGEKRTDTAKAVIKDAGGEDFCGHRKNSAGNRECVLSPKQR